MAVPRPGRVVRGSATGRPLMAALDLLGRRWALRILWELTDGPRGARELRQRCDAMSPSVLYQRLAELTTGTGSPRWDKRSERRSPRSNSGRTPGHSKQPPHPSGRDVHNSRNLRAGRT